MVNDAIAAIREIAWEPIKYTDDGEAEVAECEYTTGTFAPDSSRSRAGSSTAPADPHC